MSFVRVVGPGGSLVAGRVKNCDTFFKRLMGLMFRKSLEGFDGALITPCSSIHTFFMRMDIDCFFLSETGEIKKALWNFGPGRVSGGVRGARSVLELPSGKIPPGSLKEGEILEIFNI